MRPTLNSPRSPLACLSKKARDFRPVNILKSCRGGVGIIFDVFSYFPGLLRSQIGRPIYFANVTIIFRAVVDAVDGRMVERENFLAEESSDGRTLEQENTKIEESFNKKLFGQKHYLTEETLNGRKSERKTL